MNIIKAQKEIFNSMLAGANVRKFEFDEQSIFITPDGYHGYVIPYTQIQVNLEKIKSFNKIDFQSVVTEENLCELTNEARIVQFPKRICRKLRRGSETIYFDNKYLACFQNPKFYNANKHSAIVVTEDISATMQNKVVGVILPLRMED